MVDGIIANCFVARYRYQFHLLIESDEKNEVFPANSHFFAKKFHIFLRSLVFCQISHLGNSRRGLGRGLKMSFAGKCKLYFFNLRGLLKGLLNAFLKTNMRIVVVKLEEPGDGVIRRRRCVPIFGPKE